MEIYFDDKKIDDSKIYRLTQQGELFTNRFKLGSTLCRVVEIDVDKTEVSSIPEWVYISGPYTSYKLMSLVVDQVDDQNDRYYTFTCTDMMLRTAEPFYWEETDTVQTIINKICDKYFTNEYPTIEYMGDLVVNWGSGTSAREFISYVAEVNGSFAYVDAYNNLAFHKYKPGISYILSLNDVSSLKVGTRHEIRRVFLEAGAASHYYPHEELSETVYLNEENILLTDNDERYTIQKTIEHIYNEIVGYNWYDITVEKANLPPYPFPGAQMMVGDYNTILQIDNWTYNGKWIGGLHLDLNDQMQQESYVSPDNTIKRIQIRVDRDLNQVIQKVEDVDKSVTEVIQDAQGIKGIFSNYEGVKYIDVNTDGITISSGEENTTQLNMDYDGVTITNEGKDVAQMKENTFRTSEWVLQQTRDNSVFNIFRRK